MVTLAWCVGVTVQVEVLMSMEECRFRSSDVKEVSTSLSVVYSPEAS